MLVRQLSPTNRVQNDLQQFSLWKITASGQFSLDIYTD